MTKTEKSSAEQRFSANLGFLLGGWWFTLFTCFVFSFFRWIRDSKKKRRGGQFPRRIREAFRLHRSARSFTDRLPAERATRTLVRVKSYSFRLRCLRSATAQKSGRTPHQKHPLKRLNFDGETRLLQNGSLIPIFEKTGLRSENCGICEIFHNP